MSVDHFSPRSTAVSEKDPLFLHVKAGMTVVVSEGTHALHTEGFAFSFAQTHCAAVVFTGSSDQQY